MSARTRLLPGVLGAVAGSLDVVGLLQLGLFTAHITGNLALLIAHAVGGGDARVGPMLSVPVFIAALALTRVLVDRVPSIGLRWLRPLLVLELALLVACFAVGVGAGSRPDPNAAITILAGMLGVAAMAVQNALVPLGGGPPTTAVTGNVTRLTLDVVAIGLGGAVAGGDQARARVRQTWPVLAGFAAGCGLGAAGLAAVGRWSLAVPAGLAVLALALASASREA